MEEIIQRAIQRKKIALEILNEIDLIEKWGEVGEAHLVGATAYNLMVNHDIDIETFCNIPCPENVFKVLGHLAAHRGVVEIKFHNYMNSPLNGLYSKLTYRYPDNTEGTLWNVDMWLFPSNHRGPLSRDLVGFMNKVLTDRSRKSILDIKEHLVRLGLNYPSVFIYRAVLVDGIEGIHHFLDWMNNQDLNETFKLETLTVKESGADHDRK
ncbi:hypothetical protein LCL96_01725 [Rossellomorea aquimaris]|uniref:hypothetical protein n=1 Tax=Rossellomorea aquimaris TaxID=189382 RepID=UPI001CD72B3B|nr:hypothetical protein [Rossellomorea aquimaris]MCA1057634.1 hypothetical protein [Rossellomorea aquimaris]